jgi:hypothetical protein
MDDRELIETLSIFNFWGGKPFTGIPRPGYVKQLERLVGSGQVVVAKGVRRSGKTTILFQFLRHLIEENGLNPKKTLYVNFEDTKLPVSDGPALIDNIMQAHRAFVDPDGPEYIILDEVQRVPEWERWVRIQQDRKKEHIIISGSSANVLSKELATLLTGRHLDMDVFPLSLSEFCRFRDFDPDNALVDPERLKALASEYISSSMFPQAVMTAEPDIRERVVQTIYRDILYHDVARRYDIRDIEKLEAVSNILLSSVPGPVTLSKTWRNLQKRVSLDTVDRFFRYLQEPYLAFFVKSHSFKAKERERWPRKVYGIDAGILTAVSHNLRSDREKLLENAVFLDIRRAGFEVYRYSGRREVDFLVWRGESPFLLVNVSLDIGREDTLKREIEGLREAMTVYCLERGTIVTLDDRRLIKVPEGEINIIPYREWSLTEWPRLASKGVTQAQSSSPESR